MDLPQRQPTPAPVREFITRFATQIGRNRDPARWLDSYRRLHPQASEEELQFLNYELTHQSYREEALQMVEKLLSEPLSFDEWCSEVDIDQKYGVFHDEYGDSAGLLSDFKRVRYKNYLEGYHRGDRRPWQAE